jgi:hypothetical protein
MGPLYRAFAAEDGNAFHTFVGYLGEGVGAVGRLREADSCVEMLANPDDILNTVDGVRKLSGGMKVLAKGLMAFGASGISGKPVQIAGFAGVLIENNPQKKWGERLDGVAQVLSGVALSKENMLRYCTILDGTTKVLDAVNRLQLPQLDVPISSRASQASVDALATSVQLTLDSTGRLSGDHSLLLRVQIEQALAAKQKGVALFSLPHARQGLLELVREIAEDTIVQEQSLHGPIQRAWDLLAAGDNAASIADFERAFDLYGDAYRTAAK